MSSTVRRVDYSPDEMLGAVSGEMSPTEFGVYWMICTLIYARRSSVPNDATWIAGRFKRSTDPRTIRAAIDALLKMKASEGRFRLELLDDGELVVRRCLVEVEKASNRIRKASENGVKSGQSRSRSKHDQGLPPTDVPAQNELSPSPSPTITTITPKVPKGTVFSEDFIAFWSGYPHKVGKDAAWRSWQRRKDRPALEVITAAVAAYVVGKPADRPWLNPATWINQGRWADVPAETLATAPAAPEIAFELPPDAKPFRHQLLAQLGVVAYRQWIEPLEITRNPAGDVKVWCASKFTQHHIAINFSTKIASALGVPENVVTYHVKEKTK